MSCLTAKGEHCLHLFTFLLKQNLDFELIQHIFECFIMYLNENYTKKLMCNIDLFITMELRFFRSQQCAVI